jgi:hypothetical protein
MRKRKLWWTTGLAVLLLAVAAFGLWPPQPDRVTQENFDRINEGMSRADVEAILGPPGDYSGGPLVLEAPGPPVRFEPAKESRGTDDSAFVEWANDSGRAQVVFDGSGRVDWRYFGPVRRMEQTALDNLLWRTKRQWRRWFVER